MATKIYCLGPNMCGEYEDMSITLSLDKALEWLKKHSKTGQILEYTVLDGEVSQTWSRIYYYDNTDVPKVVYDETSSK